MKMKEFDPHIKKCLEKGLIHIGFHHGIVHVSFTNYYRQELFLITSGKGLEHALLLLFGKVLDPAFEVIAERDYPYPQSVGKESDFENAISKSYVRMYLLGDVITIEQEQTEIPELYIYPGVYMSPGIYCRKGIGHDFNDAVKSIISSKYFIKGTCVPDDPFK